MMLRVLDCEELLHEKLDKIGENYARYNFNCDPDSVINRRISRMAS